MIKRIKESYRKRRSTERGMEIRKNRSRKMDMGGV